MSVQWGETVMSWPRNFVHVLIAEGDGDLIFGCDGVGVAFCPSRVNLILVACFRAWLYFGCVWQRIIFFMILCMMRVTSRGGMASSPRSNEYS